MKIYRKIFIIFFIILSACGYRFAGKGELPEGIKDVNILMFENKTSESRIESYITNDIIYEFSKNGITVKNSEKTAILKGVINSIYTAAISHSSINESEEERVYISIDVSLEDGKGRVIKQLKNIIEEEDYTISSSNKLDTESAKIEAVQKLSKKLAEKVFLSFSEDF